VAPDAEVVRRRLTTQGLAGPPARDAVSVARRLLAIQGQDPRGARLAIRARTRGVTGADVDRALTEDRSLVITWCNRGTLHLIASEDYPLLHALTTPPLRAGSDRRLAQEGINPTAARRGVSVITRALAQCGPLSGHALRERLQSADVPVAGQALVHLLFRATLDGVIVRGPIVGGQHAYALVRDWLPGAPERTAAVAADRSRALAELARRYLAGHGPANARDLARWAGLPLRDARAGLDAIAGELRERDNGLVELADGPRAGRLPPPRLLGAFEPLLMGWRSRMDVLGAHESQVVTGGIFRGFALIDGRAAGVWRFANGAGTDGVALEPFSRLAPDVADALARETAAVTRFLGWSGRPRGRR
jgi:hypothetical protein